MVNAQRPLCKPLFKKRTWNRLPHANPFFLLRSPALDSPSLGLTLSLRCSYEFDLSRCTDPHLLIMKIIRPIIFLVRLCFYCAFNRPCFCFFFSSLITARYPPCFIPVHTTIDRRKRRGRRHHGAVSPPPHPIPSYRTTKLFFFVVVSVLRFAYPTVILQDYCDTQVRTLSDIPTQPHLA